MSEVSDPTPPTQTKMNQMDPVNNIRTDPWIPEGQADDRTPMDGSVRKSDENASGQRAFARRYHQLMFKKWSQTRNK